MRVPIRVEIEPELLRAIQRAALERETTAEAIAVEVLEEWRREGTARERRSRKTTEGLAQVTKQGRMTGRAPFGWRLKVGPDSARTDPPVDLKTGKPMAIETADDRPSANEAPKHPVYRTTDARRGATGARPELEHDPEERAILDRMVELRRAGLGAMRIANTLNDAGMINPRTKRPWNYGTVAGILRTYRRRARLGIE